MAKGGHCVSRDPCNKAAQEASSRCSPSGFTKGSVASDEPPGELVLVDKPNKDKGITRVTGPFVVEACLPTPQSLDGIADEATPDETGDHVARMIEVLRKSHTLALPGNRRITLKSIRRRARTLSLRRGYGGWRSRRRHRPIGSSR
jgi:hypothetical protein